MNAPFRMLGCMLAVAVFSGLGSCNRTRPTARAAFVPPSRYVEVAIATPNLNESLRFYEKLGFSMVSQAAQPQPSARLTDGVIVVHLLQGSFPSPQLHYYLPRPGPVSEEPAARDPSGMAMVVIHATQPARYPLGKSTTPAGRFGELAIPTANLKASLAFWQEKGFKPAFVTETPYPWAIVSDGSITLGLHQTTDAHFTSATLTYYATDMAARIATLKKEGFAFSDEANDAAGQAANATLIAPEGQKFYLFQQEE